MNIKSIAFFIEKQCREKDIPVEKLLTDCGLSKNVVYNMKKTPPSVPSIDKIYAIAQYLNVSIDYLVGLDAEPNRRPAYNEGPVSHSDNRMSTHDRAFYFIRYRVGREDADFMFQAADIPIEDSQYQIPPKALHWIAAHCGIGVDYMCMQSKIFMSDLEGDPWYSFNVENLDDLLKDPEIEKMENRYLKLKYEKYAAIAESKCWDSDNTYQSEIHQGFDNLIDKFKGDIGSQFALLDRCRQCAAQLVEDNAQRREEEEALKKEGA